MLHGNESFGPIVVPDEVARCVSDLVTVLEHDIGPGDVVKVSQGVGTTTTASTTKTATYSTARVRCSTARAASGGAPWRGWRR